MIREARRDPGLSLFAETSGSFLWSGAFVTNITAAPEVLTDLCAVTITTDQQTK